MLVLSIIFKDAIREEIITLNTYPFTSVRIKKDKATREFLTKEQLEKLANYKTVKPEIVHLAKDMFLFSCYAGGLRFSDVVTLTWENYNEEEQRISKNIKKTKRFHQFRIGKKAVEIIEKYKSKDKLPTDFIFPVIDDSEFFNRTAALSIQSNWSKKLFV